MQALKKIYGAEYFSTRDGAVERPMRIAASIWDVGACGSVILRQLDIIEELKQSKVI